MALAIFNYSDAQAGQTLAAAQPDRIIRVERLIITSWVGVAITLVSDPGGVGEAAISATLRYSPGGLGVFEFPKPYALTTERGRALGLNTSFQSSAGNYGVMVWYEYVQ
ncbi:MAG: hypothetical protein SF069_09865 [Phycisphaerae bacterium]|nr:hypothetical protein [Phycisphaerae bacterium]